MHPYLLRLFFEGGIIDEIRETEGFRDEVSQKRTDVVFRLCIQVDKLQRSKL